MPSTVAPISAKGDSTAGSRASDIAAEDNAAAPRLPRHRDYAKIAKMRPNEVTIGQLRDHLSRHLKEVQRGRELIVLDRDKPVARLVAYEPPSDDDEIAALIRDGILIAPKVKGKPKRLPRAPKVKGNLAIEALLAEREEGR
jgi:antitoxin (DNA-binding transcriptional repressor) of toxin-antitoxin stability system